MFIMFILLDMKDAAEKDEDDQDHAQSFQSLAISPRWTLTCLASGDLSRTIIGGRH